MHHVTLHILIVSRQRDGGHWAIQEDNMVRVKDDMTTVFNKYSEHSMLSYSMKPSLSCSIILKSAQQKDLKR